MGDIQRRPAGHEPRRARAGVRGTPNGGGGGARLLQREAARDAGDAQARARPRASTCARVPPTGPQRPRHEGRRADVAASRAAPRPRPQRARATAPRRRVERRGRRAAHARASRRRRSAPRRASRARGAHAARAACAASASSRSMARSKHTAAHFTFVEECDVDRAQGAARAAQGRAPSSAGVKLTFLPFIVKAVVAALKKHPTLNSALDEATQRDRHPPATTTSASPPRPTRASSCPWCKDADRKSAARHRARDRAPRRRRARAARLKLEDLRRLDLHHHVARRSRAASSRRRSSTSPRSRILGVHQIKQKPVVRDGQIVIGDVMLLSLSFDHRIIDGHVGAAFAYELIDSSRIRRRCSSTWCSVSPSRFAVAVLVLGVFGCSGSERGGIFLDNARDTSRRRFCGKCSIRTTDAASVLQLDSRSNDAITSPIDAIDPGAPPAECTPPCLWNIFKTCRIIPPCWDEDVDGGVMSCRPSTGITWFVSSTKRTVYNRDGSVCYTADLGATTVYHDATGTHFDPCHAARPADAPSNLRRRHLSLSPQHPRVHGEPRLDRRMHERVVPRSLSGRRLSYDDRVRRSSIHPVPASGYSGRAALQSLSTEPSRRSSSNQASTRTTSSRPSRTFFSAGTLSVTRTMVRASASEERYRSFSTVS